MTKRRKRRRLSYPCADCGVNTLAIGEYYMVEDDVWNYAWWRARRLPAARRRRPFLCIGCLEARIGRRLTESDFKRVPINDPDDPDVSVRMRDRLMDFGHDIAR